MRWGRAQKQSKSQSLPRFLAGLVYCEVRSEGGGALRKCPADIFSERASLRGRLQNSVPTDRNDAVPMRQQAHPAT